MSSHATDLFRFLYCQETGTSSYFKARTENEDYFTRSDLIVNSEKLDKVVPQSWDMLPVFKQVSADHVH